LPRELLAAQRDTLTSDLDKAVAVQTYGLLHDELRTLDDKFRALVCK
jgi:hypothetical protein